MSDENRVTERMGNLEGLHEGRFVCLMNQVVVIDAVWVGFLVLFLGAAVAAMMIHARNKRLRRTEPPEPIRLLRRPGETLVKKEEKLFERMMARLVNGALGAVMVFIVPGLVVWLVPNVQALPLLVATVLLCVAVMVWLVRRSVVDLEKRSELRLGLRGEQLVGEQMAGLSRAGYWLFHDVPVEIDGKRQNIDHVAVGPLGVVVVETKMRSLPKKETGKKAAVRFDGERLNWPFHGDDRAPVRQVARYAAWIEAFVKEACGKEVEAAQIIAIPGWEVIPGKFYKPRVVSGLGVSDAVLAMTDGWPHVLNQREIQKVVKRLDALCRDVTD